MYGLVFCKNFQHLAMRTFLKNKLENFIFKCIDKSKSRKVSSGYNPFDIIIGQNSSIVDPLKIDGARNIEIGSNTHINRNAWISAFDSYGSQKFSPKIKIGNNVVIGNYACITAINAIKIGDNCLFSEYVYISDHSHGFEPTKDLSPALQDLNSKGPVEIGENTFLGFRVCILPGVKLGKNCVVGSNSVVTKSFPDFSMVGGIPARLLKVFSFEKNEWEPVTEKE